MVKIKKDIFVDLRNAGFFDSPKTIHEVKEKLAQKGYTITGKKASRVAQTLTFLCRGSEAALEREAIPKSEWKMQGKWRYKKAV
jgi:hypothetical protein